MRVIDSVEPPGPQRPAECGLNEILGGDRVAGQHVAETQHARQGGRHELSELVLTCQQ
jgi:hypothetical protein